VKIERFVHEKGWHRIRRCRPTTKFGLGCLHVFILLAFVARRRRFGATTTGRRFVCSICSAVHDGVVCARTQNTFVRRPSGGRLIKKSREMARAPHDEWRRQTPAKKLVSASCVRSCQAKASRCFYEGTPLFYAP
jgi:hypothetical protein